jgi:putative acetyltransferase
MLIRAMDVHDVDKIHRIHTEAVNITCASHYDAERREAWLRGRTPEGYLRAQQNGENFLVAILEGAVVGFASWRAEELLALFVLPSRQRRGVAHSLFDECGRRANESNFAITKLNATLNAREFYEQLGFKVTRRGYEIKRGKRIYHYKMRKA